jgi:hypothetical protein
MLPPPQVAKPPVNAGPVSSTSVSLTPGAVVKLAVARSSSSDSSSPAVVSACSHSRTYQASSPNRVASSPAVSGPSSTSAANKPCLSPM